MDSLRFFRNATFSTGEIARVRQMVRPSGRSLILPYDQFIEHDNRHVDAESDAGNPDYIHKLAIDQHYNAVAIHYSLAKRYWAKVEGAVPLVVKVNGKTSIPSDAQALSTFTGRVEDAVRIGAIGIGYTLYYGSPRQGEDINQLTAVRTECERYGLPLIIWAYPRGEAVKAKGGKDTSYAIESAVRMSVEMGGTIIKANLPKPAPDNFSDLDVPGYYKKLEPELQSLEKDDAHKGEVERARRVVQAAQGVPILFSGGSPIGDDDLLRNARACIEGGAFGFIFGRNMWKRPYESAAIITKKLQEELDRE